MNMVWFETAVVAILVFVIILAFDRVPAFRKLTRLSRALSAGIVAAVSVTLLDYLL